MALTVSLRNQNSGAAAEAVPACLPEGTDFSACFNPGYLADAVASVASTAVDFCFNGPLKPAVVRAHGAHGDGSATGGPNGAQGGPAERKTSMGKPATGKPATGAGNLCMIMPMRDPQAS